MSVWKPLAERYSEKAGWLLLGEVRDSTGWAGNSYADAVAVGLWKSRGMEVHGFEFKVSRSDLLRELKDAAKSAPIQRYCDRWWLVLSEASLIKEGELPPTWGLMVLKGRVLRTVVQAPKLEAEPLDRGFVASLLRNFGRHYVPMQEHKATVEQLHATADARAAEEAEKLLRDKTRNLQDDADELKRLKMVVAEFEAASGVSMAAGWNAGRIGDAVSKVLALQSSADRQLGQLRRMVFEMNRVSDEAGRALADLELVADPATAAWLARPAWCEPCGEIGGTGICPTGVCRVGRGRPLPGEIHSRD